MRGNTATNATKMATLETGAKIQVPMFVNEGEVIRVDTRTGEYMERDKSNETVDRIMWVLMLLGGAILTLFNAYGLIMGLKDPGLYLIMNLALILAGLFMVFLTLNPQVKARMGM